MNKSKNTKQCDYCERETPFSELRDITILGDWWTVCSKCAEREALLRKKYITKKYENSKILTENKSRTTG